ncbi:hypothetical protein FOXYSP1_19841 [Fusarium oxysporum f. sp. phaseoli]
MIDFASRAGSLIAMLTLSCQFIDFNLCHQIHFQRLLLPLAIHLLWYPQVSAPWRLSAYSDDFIPCVIPAWATLLASILWYIGVMARPSESYPSLLLQVLALQAIKVLLPPVIPRILRLGLLCHDILQSLTSRQLYNYQTLPDEGYIRLVRLQGLLFWRRIQLLSYPLDKCPPFEAISYTWDAQEPSSCVTINGLRLLVTKNARQILYDFTPTFGSRMIWIDSICINQGQDINDLEEKKVQIGRMSDIYRQAVRVRIWLSNSSVLEPPLPEYIRFRPQRTEYILGRMLMWLKMHAFSPTTLSSRELELLLSHNYWMRLWIVQEISFGREVFIHMGSVCVSWKSVSDFATKFWPKTLDESYRGSIIELTFHRLYDIRLSRAIVQGLRQISLIASIRDGILKGKYHRLLPLLALLVHTRASDPRDKIYGLLSLAQGEETVSDRSRKIQADYTLRAKDLYLKFSRTSLSQDKEKFDARVLIYAGIGWPRTLDNLPSWAPDWASVPESHSYGFASNCFHWGQLGIDEGRMEMVSMSGDLLTISHSRIVDSISDLTHIIDHDDTTRSWFHEICDAVGKQLVHIPKEELDLSGDRSRCYRRCPGRWRGAIYRVLVGDITSYWGEVPAATGVTTFLRPDSLPPGVPGAGYRHRGRRETRESLVMLEASYEKWLEFPHREDKDPETAEKLLTESGQFIAVCRQQTQGLRFSVSRTGRMCLVPPRAAVGDQLMVSKAFFLPYLIRPIRNGTTTEKKESARLYQLVGHCFVLGMMGDCPRDNLCPQNCNPDGYDPSDCKEQDIIIQ